MLQHRGFNLASICYLYRLSGEDLEHVLFRCDYVWNLVLSNTEVFTPLSLRDLILVIDADCKILLMLTLSTLWMERNN